MELLTPLKTLICFSARGTTCSVWPRLGLTLVIFFSPALLWIQTPNPQATILEFLTVRLGLKLKVRVHLVAQTEGDGIPIATSWQVPYVVIAKNNVTETNSKNPTQNYDLENLRLAKYDQLKMINPATLTIVEAARALGFSFT